MLKSNSKIVNEKIKSYLMEHFSEAYFGYVDENRKAYCDSVKAIEGTNLDNYPEVCNAILTIFKAEKIHKNNEHMNRQDLFIDWVSGICSAVDSSYYYNTSAVDLLGNILEETEEEKSRFSEAEAEKMMTYLLFRELTKHSSISIF